MKHLTHTSWLKWIGGTIAALSVAIALSFSSAANAQTVDLSITAEVKKSVACFSFARAHGLRQETLAVYLKRVGKAQESAGAVYHLGYTEGMLDAYGYANASKFSNSNIEARIDAARSLYKLIGCTINESI